MSFKMSLSPAIVFLVLFSHLCSGSIHDGDINVAKNEVGVDDQKVLEKLIKTNEVEEAGFDWAVIEEFKKTMRKDPGKLLQNLLEYLQAIGFMGKQSVPMVALVGSEMLKNPEVVSYIEAGIDSVEAFLRTESGKRMFKVVPKIMKGEIDDAVDIFAEEAEYNQEAFFNLLKNGDMANLFMKQLSRFLVSCGTWIQNALEDNMKLAVVNGVLISNNFPTINKRNLLKSSLEIVEKCIRVFTTFRLEVDLYREARELIDEFERMYFKFCDVSKLSEDELVTTVANFILENVMEPVKDTWMVSKHVTSKHEQCAAASLCMLSHDYRKSNKIMQTVIKLATWSTVYSWPATMPNMDEARMYKAIRDGLEGIKEKTEDGQTKTCWDVYGAKDMTKKDCDVLAMKRQQLGMNLSYDHTEL